jgi:hypothetical protein
MAQLIRLLARLMVECLHHPGVDAHTGSIRQGGNPLMQIRRNPQIESSAEFSARIHPILGAHFQKDLKGFPPFFSETLDRRGIKISPPVQAKKLTPKQTDLRVIFNDRFIPINFHNTDHGFTPCCSNHLRTLSTQPLSVSGEGCGRWNTRRSPKSRTPTREPSCSVISAPNSRNSARMSDHLMPPLVGRLKIISNVEWCRRLMDSIVPINGAIVNRNYLRDNYWLFDRNFKINLRNLTPSRT